MARSDRYVAPLSIVYQGVSYLADAIDAWPWAKRDLLGMGGYSLVYRLGSLAVKVGRIEPAEVAAQRHFAQVGLALPALLYRPQADLPLEVSYEVCPRHGLRRDILPDGQVCTCGQPADLLLMPIADPIPDAEDDSLLTRAFIAGVARDCERELKRLWDTRPANVARYRGRLVALDFGDPFASPV